ncbi:Fatty acid oxidation complex subunit alpha [Jannaschia seosinensis]|uniref:Fatty acid oxidation complex subunit alpha n=1 Tax=Jannaschia seosinensis TaxID=313367 RepID=A0A0M7BCN6_9RHOB|nr:3-hydroxyacyl-CoA dehydrogenase NAD-binding domain-containing protein [Jannaschia seosinensis]CUH40500.1 Fatty acid oxidation complex subunit alpha [Jannaschia seosinensis]
MTHPVHYETDGSIAVITVDNPPVNALGHAVRAGLVDAFDRFEEDGAAKIAVLVGAGRLFIGGADISEFGKPRREPHLPDVIARIERSTKPVVAAIHGAALGGGLEVALGCHYRVAVAGAKLGLPEVTLGLLPGAGGTQRLPRLAGMDAALDMITGGKPVTPEIAAEYGLIDRIAPDGEARAAGLTYAQELLAEGATARPTSNLTAAPATKDAATWDQLLEARHPGQISQRRAAEAAFGATALPFDEGLTQERRLFDTLMESPQREALIHAFFLEKRVSSLPELKDVEPRPLDTVGIIGGGTMGSGIATACILAGIPVTLVETTPEAAEKAHATISKNLDGAVARGKMSAEARARADLTTTTEYQALSQADLVIEAVFESMNVKRQVFGQLDAVMKDGAILATNTSYLDINEIAATTSRPADVLGLHFFSPAHVMRLLEVVVADNTAPDVVATGFALGKRLKKVAVRAGVCDGFIGNRILSHYRAAANEMILQGASPYQIDAALERFGFAMGPYKVADLAGLDIGHATRKRQGPRPGVVNPDWDDRLNEMGRLGRKTGRGYYVYEDGAQEDPEVLAIIDEVRAKHGITPRDIGDDEICNRYMAAMVNEAARVVGEGIAKRPMDVDAVLLFGYGFPRWRGGPMMYADQTGIGTIRDRIRTYAEANPEFWRTAPLIDELSETGRTFGEMNQ